MNIIFILIVVLCSGVAKIGYAQTSQYKTCMDKSGGVTVNMMDCNGAEIKVLDDRLNAVYKKIMAVADADYKTALKKAEQLWVGYRDANCQLHSQYAAGGSLGGILYGNCIVEMTSQRTKELQDLLKEETENK